MDSAYYEDLAGRLYGLLIRLDGRLGPELAKLLHHFIEVGEYGLTLEENRRRARLGPDRHLRPERSDMLALARRMKMDDLVPRALGFCPRITGTGQAAWSSWGLIGR